MAEPVGALRVDLAANVAAFAEDMAKARSIVNTTAVQMQRSMMNASKGINAAAGSILNLRNAAIVTGAVMAVALIRRSIQYADNLNDMAQRVGMNVEKFQELAYAAKLAGVEQEDFGKAMEQMSKRLGEVTGGVTNAQKSLSKLGLSISDIRGKSPDEAFKLIAQGISRVPDPMQKAALATEFFGRAGVKLIPLLNEGAAGLAKFAAEARRMGFVLSEDTIKKAAEADDEFDRIGKSAKVAGVNIAVGFLPALQEIRRIVTSQDFQDGVKTLAKYFSDLVIWMTKNKDTVAGIAAALAAAAATPGPPLVKLGAAVVAFGVASTAATPEIKALEQEIDNIIFKMNSWRAVPEGGAFRPFGVDPAKELIRLQGELERATARYNTLKLAAQAAAEPSARLTVNRVPEVNPFFVSDEVKEKLADLQFQTRVVRGEFSELADGFPELAHGMKLFGTTTHDAVTSVSQLPYQLQLLNAEQMKLKGSQLTKEMLQPWEKYQLELQKTKQLLDAGAISQETFNRKAMELRFPGLSQFIRESGDLNKQFDQLATGGLNAFADGMADAVTGAKTLKEAFRDMANSILRDMARMAIKNMLGNLLNFGAGALGNLFGGGAAAAADMPAHVLNNFGGARAGGGRVDVGKWYMVGEQGPEPFVPSSAGTVFPNDALGGSASSNITQHFHVDARGADPGAEARVHGAIAAMGRRARDEAVRAVAELNRDRPHFLRA